MSGENLYQHWDELRAGLWGLRHLLEEDSDADRIFEEFISHNEFELALHAICDSVLDRQKHVLDEKELETIEVLHELMQIVDGCSDKLRKFGIASR